ncbi:TPA: hypothetical protein ROX88_001134 [Bacillus pseudomycoides]|nr:hypothetical protein [Bacillus pseudomycoides]
MCIFDVQYQVGNVTYQKSYLLAWTAEGFQLKKEIQHVLSQEHQNPVKILFTELEEL